MKYTKQEVSEFFEKQGCKLLSEEYLGTSQKLKYECRCGNIHFIDFSQFKYKSSKGIVSCPKCRIENMLKTTRLRFGGKIPFETAEFLSKRREKCLEKYGVDSSTKSPLVKEKIRLSMIERHGEKGTEKRREIFKRQRDGFWKKYGVSHFMKNSKSKEKFQKTLQEKYGVDSLSKLSRTASKQSQLLFVEIFSRLPPLIQEKCYYAQLNREFNLVYQGKLFKYDFVQSFLLKCIEFNGSRFHPKQEQSEEETGWCIFHPERTVKEARDYEKLKFQALKERGFEILVIWDFEWQKDKQSTIQRCLDFLMQENQQKLTPSSQDSSVV